ncbi:uncharacterized protein PGTG_03558 [Puccinia graminis f. sp. tritici CRL 75-36-700-3]|uniref:Uncharacterized protein n=1 Tax=Puccinia graminis f. sp. tritici (strain CRL 75-36-700-3 / race SCCL) TaxID=418459 RepID=E3JZX7_PUCGT|nr:uncharacterized protein PGTG_03558 [Puccinia graminis f. sp. tritici CRL 75-36-700-3]EFP77602.1 hypothetical protein PGTG_03558 [Puccinia graminis f. sp. tritici CRL 75-36-700-3]
MIQQSHGTRQSARKNSGAKACDKSAPSNDLHLPSLGNAPSHLVVVGRHRLRLTGNQQPGPERKTNKYSFNVMDPRVGSVECLHIRVSGGPLRYTTLRAHVAVSAPLRPLRYTNL